MRGYREVSLAIGGLYHVCRTGPNDCIELFLRTTGRPVPVSYHRIQRMEAGNDSACAISFRVIRRSELQLPNRCFPSSSAAVERAMKRMVQEQYRENTVQQDQRIRVDLRLARRTSQRISPKYLERPGTNSQWSVFLVSSRACKRWLPILPTFAKRLPSRAKKQMSTRPRVTAVLQSASYRVKRMTARALNT